MGTHEEHMNIPFRDYNSTMTTPEGDTSLETKPVTDEDFIAYYDKHATDSEDDILDMCDEMYELTGVYGDDPAPEDITDAYYAQAGAMYWARQNGILAKDTHSQLYEDNKHVLSV